MPKGEGSPRIVSLGAEPLEGRTLLSHLSSVSATHTSSATAAQVAPLAVASKPEVEPSHTVTAVSDDLQERDAEQVAASAAQASSSALAASDRYTIPLILNPWTTSDQDDSLSSTSLSLVANRAIRVAWVDEPVAWGVASPSFVALSTLPRGGSVLTFEIPEDVTGLRIGSDAFAAQDAAPEVEGRLNLLATQGADLIAPYLPVDRDVLEQAIDRLIDGIGEIREGIAREAEAVELIPLPIAWGLGLVALEVIRRRLRDDDQVEGDERPDRDPALGLLGLPS